MTVGIVRTEINGLAGGAGLNQMVLAVQGTGDWTPTIAQSAVNAVRGLWNSFAGYLPNDVTYNTQAAIDLYDELTGTLIGTESAATTPAAVTGTLASGYASGAGAKIDWNTGVILAGRRVVGHTYVVPMGAGVYDTDGTLTAAAVSGGQTAINTYLAALNTGSLWHVVWSRPRANSQTPPGATTVQSGVLRDKTAFLRSRRD